MIKNKFLLLLLALLAPTTTYNKVVTQQRASQPIQQTQQAPYVAAFPPVQQVQQVQNKQQSSTAHQQKKRLSTYDFGSGSVLLFVTIKRKSYFILSREAYGKAKGTYDDFGGSRDPGENHPLVTAAREFFEEGIIQASTGLSLENVRQFITDKARNTQFIIASSRNVMYITNFTEHADALFNNFYAARKTMTDFHFKEKDRLALIECDELKTTISNAKSNNNVTINAQVLDPQDLQWKTENVTLRGFFVKKSRPFFMDKPYEQGMNKKIRFYDTATKAKQRPNDISQKSWSTRFWNWIKS